MNPQLTTVALGALTLAVGSLVLCGHRSADESSRYDGKPKTEELNDITMAVRSETTIPAVSKLWQFLSEMERLRRKDGLRMDVESLFYDVERRPYFSKLLNELEQSFGYSMSIKETWRALQLQHEQLSKMYYRLAVVVGIAGYPLLAIGSVPQALLSEQQLLLLWIVLIVVGFALLGLALSKHRKIRADQATCREAKTRYLNV